MFRDKVEVNDEAGIYKNVCRLFLLQRLDGVFMIAEKTEDPLISVIVPVYNVETYLPKCLDSILSQTYDNMEIIVVDDGSTDTSGKICDNYANKDSRIKVIHKANSGTVCARKSGLLVARGNYIGFVDSDDYIEEEMYEKLLHVMEDTYADFVHSGFYIDKEESISTVSNFENEIYELNADRSDFLKKYVLGQSSKLMHPCLWAKLFRADFIKKCFEEVPDSQQYGEDLINLVLCVMNAKRIATVKDMYYHYVYRTTSIVNADKGKITREVDLHNCLVNVCKQTGIYNECKDILESRFYGQIAETLSVVCQNDELHIPRYYIKDVKDLLEKKMVIYGAGDVGIDIYHQLCKYEKCEIVGMVDRNYKSIKKKYITIKSVDELSNWKYDVVLLAVKYESVANSIKESLQQIGVESKKILWKKPDNIF